MQIYQLHYFVTLVEQITYTKAAQKLHISQPSLSIAIKNLEKNVGLSLIDRTTRKSNLTKDGKILYHEAKNLLNHFQYVKDEMHRLKNDGPLKLSIGLIESSRSWMPKIVKQFQEEYEDVQIKILDVLSLQEVVQSLSHFNIHVAITNQFIYDENIEMIPIYQEKLVILLPPNHPLINMATLPITELEKESFIICQEGFQTRKDVLNAFHKARIKPNIQVEIEKFETACSMVEEGIGITILPENYVKGTNFPINQIKEIDDTDISRTVYLAYMKNRHLPPLVRRFIDLIQQNF